MQRIFGASKRFLQHQRDSLARQPEGFQQSWILVWVVFGVTLLALGAWAASLGASHLLSAAILLLGTAILLTGLAEALWKLPSRGTTALRALALALYVASPALMLAHGAVSGDWALVAPYIIVSLIYSQRLLGHNKSRGKDVVSDESRPSPSRNSSGHPRPDKAHIRSRG